MTAIRIVEMIRTALAKPTGDERNGRRSGYSARGRKGFFGSSRIDKRKSAGPNRRPRSFAVTALSELVDRSLHASIARFTAALSPAAVAQAYSDRATYLAFSPGKRWQLVHKATRKSLRFGNYVSRCVPLGQKAPRCIEPLPQDKRFVDEDWQKWPYNLI